MFSEDLSPFFEIKDFAISANFTDIARPEAESLGKSLSVSGDCLFSGSPETDDSKGCVVIFKKYDTEWKQVQILQPVDLIADQKFGHSVSSSGDYLIVSAPYNGEGCVYVFKNIGTSFVQVQKITQDDATGDDRFGIETSIDGSYLVISAIGHESYKGAVYVYHLEYEQFEQIDKLSKTDTATADIFGYRIKLQSDTIIVSSYRDNLDDVGAVYIFYRSGNTFPQESKIIVPNGITSHFGTSLDYYDDVLVVSCEESAFFVYEKINGIFVLSFSYSSNDDLFAYKIVYYPGTIIVLSDDKVYDFYGIGSSWNLYRSFDIEPLNVFINNEYCFISSVEYDVYEYKNDSLELIEYVSKFLTAKVIFDHEYIGIDEGDLKYDGYKPEILCRTVDVENFDYGSTVALEGSLYSIVSKQQDGTGISTVILNRL